MIRTFRPQCRVLITKNVQRSGVASEQAGVFDITPWLGDTGTVQYRKSLYQPCGSIVIVIPDRPFGINGRTDSLYGLIEPTDGIEIYMARSPEQYGWNESAVGNCPALARGFVRSIARDEKIGGDGKPSRNVIIQGQDYGAVFDMLRVWNLKTAVLGYPDIFDAFYKYGVDYQPLPTAKFMQIFVDLANQWLDAIYNKGGWTWRIDTDFRVSEGTHVMQGINGQEGPLWGLMLREMDSPWNELFLEDRQQNPTLVYRPTPWRSYAANGNSLTGSYLPQGTQTITAESVEINDRDIVMLSPSRSDADVQNMYWLNNPTAIQGLVINQVMAAAVRGENNELIFDTGHEHNDPTIYGERLFTGQFRQWPNETQQNPIGAAKASWEANNNTHFPAWWKQRMLWLHQANRDNSIFEQGSMLIKGNERVRIGQYIVVLRGNTQWESYAQDVVHSFQPYQSYTTQISFGRGTGFWARTLNPASPTFQEGRRGVYRS